MFQLRKIGTYSGKIQNKKAGSVNRLEYSTPNVSIKLPKKLKKTGDFFVENVCIYDEIS